MAKPLKTTPAPETTAARWLSIVGIREDGIDGLSPLARHLIGEAELVAGGARHLALAGALVTAERFEWPSPLADAYPKLLAWRGRRVVVLASGDPFNYGIGKQLAALVPAEEMRCLPQPSAFSLAAARLGWALQETATISLHGRSLAGLVRHLQPGARILALTSDESTPAKAAALLTLRGLGRSRVTVLEAMGGPREAIRRTRAESFALDGVDALNTLAIEVEGHGRALGLAAGREDDLFEHDGQLSKREVRAITLSALAPRPGELLWDIGLGAGSIAIEWLLTHPSLAAIGIEERRERAERAARNAQALGAPDLHVVTGRAPEALGGLAAPDAIFIGGGIGDAGVVETAWAALKRGGRLVANAVTLESEARLTSLFKEIGGELVRIEISRAGDLGTLHGWRAQLPVTQWRVGKP